MSAEPARMTNSQLRALTRIETTWHKHGRWPKIAQDLSGRINLVPPVDNFDLNKALDNEAFLRGLRNRGIKPVSIRHALQDPTHVAPQDGLSDEQLSAILLAVDYTSGKSLRSKLKDAGISTQTWNGWMRDPEFKSYFHSLAAKNFEDSIHVAQEGLLKSVERGDVNAIKYYNELTGRAASPAEMNARVIIAKLVQVIQTHVRDDDTLAAIARDISIIMQGGIPDESRVPLAITSI